MNTGRSVADHPKVMKAKSIVETGKTNKTPNVGNPRSASAKYVALGSAYILYMDQNRGSCIPNYLSRRASYGESVCWITLFDNRTVVKHWLRLGYGDPEWLWRHEALAFGARYVAQAPTRTKAPATDGAKSSGPPITGQTSGGEIPTPKRGISRGARASQTASNSGR